MVFSSAPGRGEPQQVLEVAVLEDPHGDAERGAEREHVHDQRLDRDDDRAGHEEQQHERGQRRRSRSPTRPARPRSHGSRGCRRPGRRLGGERRPVGPQRVDQGPRGVAGAVFAGLEPTVLAPSSRVRDGSPTPPRAVAGRGGPRLDLGGRGRGHDEHLGAGQQRVALPEVLVEGALRRATGQQLRPRRRELASAGRAGEHDEQAGTTVMTTHGTRCTTSASREKTPVSAGDSVPRRSSRRAPTAAAGPGSGSARRRGRRARRRPRPR